MGNKLLLAAIILVVFAGSFLARQLLGPGEPEEPPDGQVNRIVSMAPSITETLYALGLGDRVVGVTRYCRYPPEARKVAKVGGYHNPNFEAVVALNPDLVILLSGDKQSLSAFHKLRINTLVVCHNDVEGILDSFIQIGRVGPICRGHTGEAKAHQIVADIRARMQHIRQKTAKLQRPRVLFAIERTTGSGRLEDVYVAGSDGFFDKIVALAGGQNAYPQSSVRFPVVSTEGILWMNPQVIIDMTGGLAEGQLAKGQLNCETLLADWHQVSEVEAVKNGRVHAVSQDYAFVPGPRFIRLVADLARLIHPEIDWQ